MALVWIVLTLTAYKKFKITVVDLCLVYANLTTSLVKLRISIG